jgi:diguanylate cyclase (GGDEF)-like protein/PAS domain S-box-containing protein
MNHTVDQLMQKMKYITLCFTLTVVYFLAAKLGLLFAFEQANVSPMWPSTGLAIAALVHYGYRLWPVIFVGALAVNATTEISIIASIGIASGNALEAIVASFFIHKLLGGCPLKSVNNSFIFCVLLLAATTISATIGVTSLFLTYAINAEQITLLWITWWFGDAAGGLVFTPLLLVLANQLSISKSKYYEFAALCTCIIISAIIVFSPMTAHLHYSLSFLLLPSIVWAALRFYQPGATITVAVYAMVAAISTANGISPFQGPDINTSLLILQSFIVIIVITALALAASADETRRAQAQLHESQNELSQLLNERTMALTDSHDQLNQAVDHRNASSQSIRKLLQASMLMLPSDEQYFNHISKELAQIYDTAFAFIGVFTDSRQKSIRTLSVWCKDKHADNFSYDLQGTPCQDLIDLKIELVAQDVQQKYPQDKMLVQMGIESYFGAPIVSVNNSMLGVVVVMDDQPMQINEWVKPVLNIIATRVSFEIEREQARQELKLAASVFRETAEAIIICDSQKRILRVNPAFSRITGFSPKEAIGQTPKLFSSEKHSAAFYQSFWYTIDTSGCWQGEVWDKRKNGETFPCWQTVTAVKNKQGQIKQYIGVFSDISSKKQAEEQIYQLAHFDILTGLPNRTLFIEKLTQVLEHSRINKQSLSLLFINLDHFKLVNNSSDHSTGDILLIHVAQRLRRFIDDHTVISRLGGDEFAILVKDVADEQQIAQLSHDILLELSAPFKLNSTDVIVSASIGYSSYPQDASSAHELLRNADIAMYKAKDGGRHKYQRYTANMDKQARQRVEIESELRHAITLKQFVLHYQPQVQLSTNKVTSCEALVRWNHPEKGILPPCYFIGVAEESGLIVPLGDWILEEACRQFVLWQQQGVMLSHIAVNLSARQFVNHDLVSCVERILKNNSMSGHQLELELTESMLMKNVDQTIATMNSLRTMGVQLSLDDFGTGYSSLAYLKHFPINKIKIDKSFIDDLPNAPEDEAIVKSTISLAHGLGLIVIAEGVENKAQADYLRRHHCEEVQGYYFSVPHAGDSAALHALFSHNANNIANALSSTSPLKKDRA